MSTVLERLLFSRLQISLSEQQGDMVVGCVVAASVLEVLELVVGAAFEPEVVVLVLVGLIVDWSTRELAEVLLALVEG